MQNRFTPALWPTSDQLADPETVLFSRLIALVLSWPCKRCGKTGLCECYSDPQPPSPTQEADHHE